MDDVRSWMSSPAIVAPETLPLPEARRMLQERRIRRMPVVDAEGRLVGIVTEGDINRISDSHVSDVRDYNLYHRVADLPLRDFMTREVRAATPDMPVMAVAQLLLDHRIGGVPVVEDGRVVGMITESDLFRLIVRRHIGAADEARAPA
ncbi:MAG TPA: CBS domain-containing protein [Kouleothrix sp.]|uniref:CBS domain-containing protein n=1 Tax=Kouleothrix sp. TaxID=2779161 RepID=UPI002D03C145|nr:CBS domain-containing protein [Kouleothrix sp.]